MTKKYQAPKAFNWKHFLVDGELRAWNGASEEVYSPILEEVDGEKRKTYLGSAPLMEKEQGIEALRAAQKAYNNGRGEWPTAEAEKRIEAMEHFLSLMKMEREKVSQLLMWEIAKNRSSAYKEFDRTVAYIEDTIEEFKAMQRQGSHISSKDGVISQIRRGPLGVVLCLGPYNYPLNETFCLLIPALMMGNTVVFKPAKYGLLLLTPLVNAFQKAFPPGVVNIVFGRGRALAGPIMADGGVDVLALIGHSSSSNALVSQHPKPNRLRQILGLEAKNPAIIFADANMETAVKECVNGALSYNGQRCTALKIIYVHQSIADTFVREFSTAVDALELGHPESNAPLSPLPEKNKVAEMQHFVDDAVAKGAKVVNKRAGALDESSFFPAVLYPINTEMRIYHEEQFGPVVPILVYDELEEVMNHIAQSDYGQQCSLFSESEKTLAYAIDHTVNQVCRVNINASCQRGPDYLPFTGRKDSAVGTLSVHDALRSFSIRTLVASSANQKNLVGSIVASSESNFLSTNYLL